MKGRVVHCKKDDYDVYIGRPSKWGNPYSFKSGTKAEFKVKDREESIQKYRDYLYNNEELMGSLEELDGKVLGCWCSPEKCHGDILLEAVRLQKERDNMTEIFALKRKNICNLLLSIPLISEADIFFASDDEGKYATFEFLLVEVRIKYEGISLFYNAVQATEGELDFIGLISDISIVLNNVDDKDGTIKETLILGLYDTTKYTERKAHSRCLDVLYKNFEKEINKYMEEEHVG